MLPNFIIKIIINEKIGIPNNATYFFFKIFPGRVSVLIHLDSEGF
jgi:hypothetical protein